MDMLFLWHAVFRGQGLQGLSLLEGHTGEVIFQSIVSFLKLQKHELDSQNAYLLIIDGNPAMIVEYEGWSPGWLPSHIYGLT